MNSFPPQVVAELATPAMRISHLLWHGLRDQWLGMDTGTRATFIQKFGTKWVPPRPSRDRFGNLKFDNNAGLDFLYMHREMICMVNCLLEKAGEGPIQGWMDPPPANSRDFPPVLDYRLPPSIYRSKDDQFWQGTVLANTTALLSPATLAKTSLATLGTLIEYTVHAAMHERFGGYSTSGDLRPGMADLLTDPGGRYTKVGYDTLLDSYAAHVHPWFWKIHGWIDAQIDAWVKCNQTTVTWDAWMGPMSHCKMGPVEGGDDHGDGGHPMDGPDGPGGEVDVQELQAALKLVAAAGLDGFFRVRPADFKQIRDLGHLLMMRPPVLGEPKPDAPSRVGAGGSGGGPGVA